MVESSAKPIVTITGVTGYIGAATTLLFLKDGGFTVRGTVRSKTNQDKLGPLKAQLGDLYDQLELVEADLTDKESLVRAIAGSVYVVHTASPVTMKDITPERMLEVAIQGTTMVMEACDAAGTVKRVVITSSMAAMVAMDPAKKPAGKMGPECWSDPERPGGLSTYLKSKTLAERAAWDHVAKMPADKRYELVTILPTLVWGPIFQKEVGGSTSFFATALTAPKDPIPFSHQGIVDVRDVATAHLQGIKVPEAAGKRFVLWEGCYRPKHTADILMEEFGSLGWPLNNNEAPDNGDKPSEIDNSQTTALLGINFIPLRTTIKDMYHSMLASGMVTLPKK